MSKSMSFYGVGVYTPTPSLDTILGTIRVHKFGKFLNLELSVNSGNDDFSFLPDDLHSCFTQIQYRTFKHYK